MSDIKYHFPLKHLRETRRLSERALASQAGVSRMTVRHVESQEKNITLESAARIATQLERELVVLATPQESRVESSTLAVAQKVMADGFSSWKTHFMELVDDFRQTLDPLLLILPPPSQLDLKLKALLASIVQQLCLETEISQPSWVRKRFFLDQPWFIAETESLKASALLESPLAFRRNNIFVLGNFLERA